MKNISVIILYTNLEKQKEALHWLKTQSCIEEIQVVAMDNRDNRFSSCAQGLNYGAENSEGEYLVFMHQDVYLWDPDSIRKLRDHLAAYPEQIVGVAGKCRSGEVVTDIYETKSREWRGVRANGRVLDVAAVDECVIAMTRRRWEQLRFDAVCCDNWHGYGVDICLANTLAGGKNTLIPLEICHESHGNSQNRDFRLTVRNLVRKYRGTPVKRIQGTCVDISCTWSGYAAYRIYGFLRDILVRLDLLKYLSWMKRKIKEGMSNGPEGTHE